MRKMLLAALGAAAALTAVVPSAQAAQGCGPGGHRNYYGACRPNFYGPPPVYGAYYGGRGWWDGHRYWGHRHHWHGGWRYY